MTHGVPDAAEPSNREASGGSSRFRSHKQPNEGDTYESHGHRHPETPHTRAADDVPAEGSTRDIADLSGQQDGAVLAARQRGGGDLFNDRRLRGRGRHDPQSLAPRPRQSLDLRTDADRTAESAGDVDQVAAKCALEEAVMKLTIAGKGIKTGRSTAFAVLIGLCVTLPPARAL